MPVKALKTHPTCKLCRHPERHEIDQILYLHMSRSDLPTGKPATARATYRYLIDRFNVVNPNRDNVRSHWNNHCVWADTYEAVLSEEKEIARAIEAELGMGWETRILRRDEVLKILYSFESKKLLQSLITGANLQGAAVERIIKMANELGKQGGSDSIDDLNEKLAAAAESY